MHVTDKRAIDQSLDSAVKNCEFAKALKERQVKLDVQLLECLAEAIQAILIRLPQIGPNLDLTAAS